MAGSEAKRLTGLRGYAVSARAVAVAAAIVAMTAAPVTRAAAANETGVEASRDSFKVRLDIVTEVELPRISEALTFGSDRAEFAEKWITAERILRAPRPWYDLLGMVKSALGVPAPPVILSTVRDVRISASVVPAVFLKSAGLGDAPDPDDQIFNVEFTVNSGAARVAVDEEGAVSGKDSTPRISRILEGRASLHIGDSHPFTIEDGTGGKVRGTLTVFRVPVFRT